MSNLSAEEIPAYREFRERCATIAYCIAQDAIDASLSIRRTGNVSIRLVWYGLPSELPSVAYRKELQTKIALTLAERDRNLRLQRLDCTMHNTDTSLSDEDVLLARFAGYNAVTDQPIEINADFTVVRDKFLGDPNVRRRQVLFYLEQVRLYAS